MGRQSPTISVIVLGQESPAYLTSALTSVLTQETEFQIEVLLSSRLMADRFRESVEPCLSDERLRVIDIAVEKRHPGNAELATILRQCYGQYIALLHCDDYWTDPYRLQKLTEYLEEHRQCAVCYNRVQCVGDDGTSLPVILPDEYRALSTFDDVLAEQFIPPSSAVIRLTALKKLDAWYPRLEILEWPLFLTASLSGTVACLDETMTAFRQSPGRDAQVPSVTTVYKDLTMALRRLRDVSGGLQRDKVTARISDLHWILSQQMDRLGREHMAYRHRQMCFHYGGWRSRLPLRSKISSTVRPLRVVHRTAVLLFEVAIAPRRHASVVGFALSLIWNQPSWIFRMAKAIFTKGLRGLSREWKIIDYLYGSSPQWYARWIRTYDTLTAKDRVAIERRIELMSSRPVFSVIMPVYNTPEEFLSRALDSVKGQLYPHWELCIANDASTLPHVERLLTDAADSDDRVRVIHRRDRGNISAASNSANELASGEFLVFLDHDDELSEHALYMVAEEINRFPDSQVIYSDEDRLDHHGQRVDPYFKTDWNPDSMLSHNMICHLAVFRRQLVHDVGGCREGFEGGQDFDLALRCTEQVPNCRIRHIPAILYHWRRVAGSVSAGPESSVQAHDAGQRAIREHLERQKSAATVRTISDRGSPHYRVTYPLNEPPWVSIVIPTRDRRELLEQCVHGLLHETDYPQLEILVVDNESSDPSTLEYLSNLQKYDAVRILKYKGDFNYSAINNYAVGYANGDVLCLLNNDTEVIHADWLHEMVSHAVRPEVGAVGAKLLFPDDRIQHAGVLIGFGGLAGHAFTTLPVEAPVQFGRLESLQGVSCVTAACLVLRKAVYQEVGGLDEKALAVAYNDVDVCLKIVSAGYRIIWTPYAKLYHHESASRGRSMTREAKTRDRREGETIRSRWAGRIAADPNMNPNVSAAYSDMRPAFPPRTRRPWH